VRVRVRVRVRATLTRCIGPLSPTTARLDSPPTNAGLGGVIRSHDTFVGTQTHMTHMTHRLTAQLS
jgi:hypothetical protein